MCVLECMARGDSLCSRTVMSKPGDETQTQTQAQTYAVCRHSVRYLCVTTGLHRATDVFELAQTVLDREASRLR
jgi:hypothetical protein